MKAILLFFALYCPASFVLGQWTILNPPDNLFNNTIYSTVIDRSGKVYAAGKFTDSSHNNAVAVLNNGLWSELGGGARYLHAISTIYALALDSSG